jgi:hypothetical protein
VLAAFATLLTALALPTQGVLAPGRSLGDIHLGDTRAAVVASWGRGYGVCRGCARPTLYFNYRRFDPHGAGVTLRGGRVSAIFTLWSPPGWRTTRGLAVGDNAARLTELYGALPTTTCAGYDARILHTRGSLTVIYLVEETVWGFALMRRDEPVCR